MQVPEYSWADPPIEMPDTLYTLVNSEPRSPFWLGGDIALLEEFVAFVRNTLMVNEPGDSNQREIEQILDDLTHRDIVTNDRQQYLSRVWTRLMMMEDERLFFREMVGVLGTFSPTLKTVEVDGVVDRKWMAAVAG